MPNYLVRTTDPDMKAFTPEAIHSPHWGPVTKPVRRYDTRHGLWGTATRSDTADQVARGD
jgi:hypothetical protein